MPRSQLEGALVAELGPGWRAKVAEFDFEPLAAASIGQVHAATLHDGRRVVMKIQCAEPQSPDPGPWDSRSDANIQVGRLHATS